MTLGDKIVVMEHGRVQQVGTPTEVFFKPRNTFVANFVGTPSMNLIDGRVHRDGAICVDLDGLVQPVPERFEAALRAQPIEQVKWGIRPESIKLLDSAEQAGDIPVKSN